MMVERQQAGLEHSPSSKMDRGRQVLPGGSWDSPGHRPLTSRASSFLTYMQRPQVVRAALFMTFVPATGPICAVTASLEMPYTSHNGVRDY